MAYQTYDHRIAARNSVPGSIGDWISARIHAIGDFYAERGRLAQLAALDARTLRDIGLGRAELTSVAHNVGDPTRRQR
ncbi:MAG: DUF1127 domain-containing protein [Minwuia sp.]|uniref:DUF1127 domain-containing protein n=1 Tax=Minwuia sp. TaxID=2493630 RepID=UPI003A8827F5